MHPLRTLLPLAGSLALLAAPAFAQGNWTPPTPAEQAQHQVSRLTGVLALTSEQQTAALTLFTNEATAAQPLRTNERTLHQTLETAIDNDDLGTIATTATQLGAINGQMEGLRATAEAGFYKLLTADQQTRYKSMHEHGPHGMGGPGAPPPPPPAE